MTLQLESVKKERAREANRISCEETNTGRGSGGGDRRNRKVKSRKKPNGMG